MSTPTPTPDPWIADGYDLRQKNGRMIAYFGPHHTPADEYPLACRLQDEANAQWVAAARNELAAAQAECERLKFATEGHLLKTIQQQAELTRLRADNLTAHQMACAAGLERDQLRAEVSEARRAWLGDDYGHLPLIEALEKFRSDSDAESDRADVLYQRSCEVEHALRAELAEAKVERETVAEASLRSLEAYIDKLKQFAERAEKAEAALAEWSVLNLWGGTPEIIHEFIKGQQDRIHHCQDLETELDRLRAEVERLKELLRIESASAQHALAAAERAEADTARLDWLLDRSAQTYHSYSNHLGGGNYVQYHKDRAAIDAAMKT